jgi:predicted TPR repeat methyltransferase
MRRSGRISVQDALRIGVGLHKDGCLEDAGMVYRDILRSVPEHPDALHFMGVLKHQLGDSREAAELIGRALEIVPDNPSMLSNFGNVNRELDRLEVAEEAYRKAIELAPSSPDAYCNLGSLLRSMDKPEEAKALLSKAIELNPDHGEAHYNLANLLRDEKAYEGAIDHYIRAIALHAHKKIRGKASANLATLLRRAGRIEDAVKVINDWLAREPDNPTARHTLAALTGEGVPARASDAYVKQLFDSFANSFDKVLDSLHYQAPELVGERLRDLFPAPRSDQQILDAGCGTGLAGGYLRPYASRLIGVDLSAVMLSKARARELYDELIESEIVAFLSGRRTAFDLIVSVDTLCYFGDLRTVLEAVRRALRPGGVVCFTLEKTVAGDQDIGDEGSGYKLEGHGRYSHRRVYVERLLSGAGFVAPKIDEAVLRLEGGDSVPGYVVSATVGDYTV